MINIVLAGKMMVNVMLSSARSSDEAVAAFFSSMGQGGTPFLLVAVMMGMALLVEWLGRRRGSTFWASRIGNVIALLGMSWGRQFRRFEFTYGRGETDLWPGPSVIYLMFGIYVGAKYFLGRFFRRGQKAEDGTPIQEADVEMKEIKNSFYFLFFVVAVTTLFEFLPIIGSYIH